jgi:hypothetical protein
MRHSVACVTYFVSLATLLFSIGGCALMPESIQPGNLQKLNRGSGYSEDPFSSIPDREATAAARALALRHAFEPQGDSEEESANL